jgi:hypothetical protein
MGVLSGTQIWFWVSNSMMLVSYVEVLRGKIYHCHYVNKLSSMVYEILFLRDGFDDSL